MKSDKITIVGTMFTSMYFTAAETFTHCLHSPDTGVRKYGQGM